jgi:hypothetical protein
MALQYHHGLDIGPSLYPSGYLTSLMHFLQAAMPITAHRTPRATINTMYTHRFSFMTFPPFLKDIPCFV